MSSPSLGPSIILSLRQGEMFAEFPKALLTQDRNRARVRDETNLWDYKRELAFDDPYKCAEFAKDVLAFHNTEGGAIVVGVSDDYSATGVPRSMILDTKRLRDKIRKYVGDSVSLFQHSIEVPNGRFVWVIFVKKYVNEPEGTQANGPLKNHRPVFSRGQFFRRDGDEVKICTSDADITRLFRGGSGAHLSAYSYDVDEPFNRLLRSNCERFIGRRKQVDEIKKSLELLRQHVVALDGLGGVGKTAIAIEAVRELYNEKKFDFIVSLSAKSKVWVGHVRPRQAAFAGLRTLLTEIADVLTYVKVTNGTKDDTTALKESLIGFMEGQRGLLLLDNLEEISDEGVFAFIKEEIPAPVKVLVTSRIAKDIGAATISIPGMTDDDSSDLLKFELDRQGYSLSPSDTDDFNAVLRACGGVPLAIKWAAQITAESRSLRQASSILRGSGPGKQELLSFVFATMFDALSDRAKDVARLIPHLGLEWKPMTIAIALNLPVDEVRMAIYELSDKGILYELRNGRAEEYEVLPLTKEFLSAKWNENRRLREAVDKRFSEKLSSDSGFLLDLPVERRIELLANTCAEKMKTGKYADVLELVHLAQTWLSETTQTSFEARFLFMEGRCLYSGQKRERGLFRMRQAVKSHEHEAALGDDDIAFYAEALFKDGGTQSEKEASEHTLHVLRNHGQISEALLAHVIATNVKRSNPKLIAQIMVRLTDGEMLCMAFDRIFGLLTKQNQFTYREDWRSALKTLEASEVRDSVLKKEILTRYADLR